MTEGQDPDKAPEETQLEQLLELRALTGEDAGLGPADLAWNPDDDQDLG
ncbi:hypothetical protein SPF06_19550 [Sinomonas sp. JGH33]|uniref:Uncharacterized protein n=1 Tax=Sinomonas terricola TaxID=3110330 RepID=A0ABU5TB68_9MICC|nr:hypothetical protein [Sinomonas sp. JGH33]MEA5456924.1 hypothetical protein [Sinomonas sp. JGH33]